MITTHLRNLLTAVVCLFAGVSAQAQFSGSATQYPTTDYSASPISFELSAVAAALDTDAATLGAALAEYIEAESPATSLFFVQQTDGTESSDPTADSNGFWMDAEGNNVGYGDNSVFYASPSVDVDANTFAFYCGQMPNVMEADQSAKATIKLKFNGKEVSFAITLNVIAKPVYDIPEPATILESQLNVVGSAEITMDQYPRTGYDPDDLVLELGDLAAKLGAEPEAIEGSMDKLIWATWYNNGDIEEGGGMKKDSLTNVPTGEGVGYWFRPVQNELGETYGEVAAASWGSDDKFYVNNLAFDAQTAVLSAKLGQYPSSCASNEKWYGNIYFIYGDKAYRVTIRLNLLEREAEGLEGMTKVGEDEFKIEQYPTKNYESSAFYPDVDAIAAALGCNVGDFSMQALDEDENFAAGPTAGNQGYWFNSAGYVTSWGNNSSFFIENPTANDYSQLNIGQYPNTLSAGDEVSANLYFVNGENYYTIHVVLSIMSEDDKPDPSNFVSVATKAAVIQAIPSSEAYAIDQTWTLDPDQLEALIGVTEGTLYAANNPEESEAPLSDAYSCTPYPGFWLSTDGYASTWGSSPVGITYEASSGEFTFYQMPGLNNVGDVFKAPLYLANTETGKMVTINFTVQFVDAIVEYEEVGSASIVLPVGTDEATVDFDLSEAAEALGVTVDEILDNNNYYFHGLNADGIYISDEDGDGSNADNGLAFDYDGGYNANGSIFFTIEKNGDGAQIIIAADDDVDEDFSATGTFCVRVGDKQFVYNVRFLSPDGYTGISTIADSNAANTRIFDLSGRQIQKPTRGLYIQNGKKIVVK